MCTLGSAILELGADVSYDPGKHRAEEADTPPRTPIVTGLALWRPILENGLSRETATHG